MKLNAPKKLVFLIAVIVAIVAVIAAIIPIPFISGISFWLLLGAFVLLVLGNLLKGL